jgi:hypothetical protein
MKKEIFEIPADSMVEFAEQLADLKLPNTLIGSNSDDEVLVEVSYDSSNRDAYHELCNWYDDNIADNE